MQPRLSIPQAILLALTLTACNAFALTFRVATYNVENYLDHPTESRHFVKSAAAKAKICESIRAIKPDVLALEEMGTTNALLELQHSLKNEGLDLPYWDEVEGPDTNIHVTVLSRFPIIARHPHTRESFLLDGRRFHVCRGFAEDEIQVTPHFTFTLLVAHLKSRRPSPMADQAEQRYQEAKMLREIVDHHFKTNPEAKLVVLGDLNDVKDAASIKEIIGRGHFKLFDTRPAERNGDNAPPAKSWYDPATITWTHFYGKEDIYSRIDYILLSPAMADDWLKKETYIPRIANWGVGSDHRPIVAAFTTD